MSIEGGAFLLLHGAISSTGPLPVFETHDAKIGLLLPVEEAVFILHTPYPPKPYRSKAEKLTARCPKIYCLHSENRIRPADKIPNLC